MNDDRTLFYVYLVRDGEPFAAGTARASQAQDAVEAYILGKDLKSELVGHEWKATVYILSMPMEFTVNAEVSWAVELQEPANNPVDYSAEGWPGGPNYSGGIGGPGSPSEAMLEHQHG